VIGIFDWERRVTQAVSIDLDMSADVARAAASDDIADALNYKDVAKRIASFTADSRFRLVETLAERIAGIVREEFGVDGQWQDATVEAPPGSHAWQRWSVLWEARPGEHELACRATDGNGERQPIEARWDLSGFGNNGVQRINVTVTD
jgi:7,8-dihydroneopterin aldolase/epimerase/oxygenase